MKPFVQSQIKQVANQLITPEDLRTNFKKYLSENVADSDQVETVLEFMELPDNEIIETSIKLISYEKE